MALLPNRNCDLMGDVVWGDLGGYTAYTDQRGQVVWYPKSPPLNPPSALQIYQRRKWSTAMAMWRALTEDQRDAWRLAARRNHCQCGATALFIHYFCKPDDLSWKTLERNANVTLVTVISAQQSS
jgi:hypothetical protein